MKKIKLLIILFGVILVNILFFNYFEKNTEKIKNEGSINQTDFVGKEEGVYSLEKIGVRFNLPKGFSAEPSFPTGGVYDKDYPNLILIFQNNQNMGCDDNGCNFFQINIFEYNKDVYQFIQDVNTRNYRPIYELIKLRQQTEVNKINDIDTIWTRIKASQNEDVDNESEIYFVNGKFGFILQSDQYWLKEDILKILNGISFY